MERLTMINARETTNGEENLTYKIPDIRKTDNLDEKSMLLE
jgi:hypothetical protein